MSYLLQYEKEGNVQAECRASLDELIALKLEKENEKGVFGIKCYKEIVISYLTQDIIPVNPNGVGSIHEQLAKPKEYVYTVKCSDSSEHILKFKDLVQQANEAYKATTGEPNHFSITDSDTTIINYLVLHDDVEITRSVACT